MCNVCRSFQFNACLVLFACLGYHPKLVVYKATEEGDVCFIFLNQCVFFVVFHKKSVPHH